MKKLNCLVLACGVVALCSSWGEPRSGASVGDSEARTIFGGQAGYNCNTGSGTQYPICCLADPDGNPCTLTYGTCNTTTTCGTSTAYSFGVLGGTKNSGSVVCSSSYCFAIMKLTTCGSVSSPTGCF